MLIRKEYINTMSLILGVIGSNGVVISADGRATYNDGSPPTDNYRKIHKLSGGIIVGFAGTSLGNGHAQQFLLAFQQLTPVGSSLSLRDYANELATMAKVSFSLMKAASGFQIGFLIAGYDRDDSGKATEPKMFRVVSTNNYEVEPPATYPQFRLSFIVDATPNLDGFPEVTDTSNLKSYTESVIRKNESPTVGGDITTFIIKEDGIKETIHTTD